MGFLAEYQLEHKIEKDREKHFIKQLYRDIKFDTTSLQRVIEARKRKASLLDTLSALLVSKNLENQSSDLYYFARYATRFYDVRFIPNDGTLQQLKNAGNMRLIHRFFFCRCHYTVRCRTTKCPCLIRTGVGWQGRIHEDRVWHL